MAVFWLVICGLAQDLFLGLLVNFHFFNSCFPVGTHELEMSSGAHLNKLLFLWWAVIENSSVLGYTRSGASLKTGTQLAFKTLCFIKKIR